MFLTVSESHKKDQNQQHMSLFSKELSTVCKARLRLQQF